MTTDPNEANAIKLLREKCERYEAELRLWRSIQWTDERFFYSATISRNQYAALRDARSEQGTNE